MEKWCIGEPLPLLFPTVYELTEKKEALVAELIQWNNGGLFEEYHSEETWQRHRLTIGTNYNTYIQKKKI